MKLTFGCCSQFRFCHRAKITIHHRCHEYEEHREYGVEQEGDGLEK
jgi:hypothetical protein